MKIAISLILIALLFSCQADKQNEPVPEKAPIVIAESFDWLLGEWQRSNDKEGKQTYETWTKTNNTEYAGHGFTLQQQDTTFQERMSLVKHENTWQLEVAGAGNPKPVVFKLTKTGDNSFTCENPEHDFPTKIEYARNGDQINAAIFGGDQRIPFDFVKRQR